MLNLVLKFVPTVVTAVMMTTAMSATINPYLIAVAPVSFVRKVADEFSTTHMWPNC